ncbi:MAG: hypothetical protein Q8K31_07085 [Burkholderiaceae bacterium]|nr:hypothetical protein [Burkholderiaceae bacterium]
MDSLTGAKRELLASRFIFETVEGRGRIPARFGVTWQPLNPSEDHDVVKTARFPLHGYDKAPRLKVILVKPQGGVQSASNVPAVGTRVQLPCNPIDGAVSPRKQLLSAPLAGTQSETTFGRRHLKRE